MVWIYGDGLIAGEDNDYYTSKLVTQGDVIVVKFNYLWILRLTVNRRRASSSSTTTGLRTSSSPCCGTGRAVPGLKAKWPPCVDWPGSYSSRHKRLLSAAIADDPTARWVPPKIHAINECSD
jgi:hypothetical protein